MRSCLAFCVVLRESMGWLLGVLGDFILVGFRLHSSFCLGRQLCIWANFDCIASASTRPPVERGQLGMGHDL